MPKTLLLCAAAAVPGVQPNPSREKPPALDLLTRKMDIVTDCLVNAINASHHMGAPDYYLRGCGKQRRDVANAPAPVPSASAR